MRNSVNRGRKLIVALFLISAMTPAIPNDVDAGQQVLSGCEAADVRTLLSNAGGVRWLGDVREIGALRFVSFADLSCGAQRCSIDTGLRISQSSFVYTSQPAAEPVPGPVLSGPALRGPEVGRNSPVDLWGRTAAAVREGLGAGRFQTDDQRTKLVWVDYGMIAETINVRARTEISCSMREDHCQIRDRVLVFAPYDDEEKCGFLAADASR